MNCNRDALELHPGQVQNARMNKALSAEALQQEACAFRRSFDAVVLSTVSRDGIPDASYAPCFLDDDDRCHVLISQLAQHTRNLVYQPVASLMWVESVKSSGNVFARRRLILQCDAVSIEREGAAWQRIVQQMEDRFGNTVKLLAGLPDFMLFQFDALEGNYIRGFAQAYPVTGNALVMSERRTR